MNGLALLKKHRVDYNILCTVNAVNGDHPLEVYRFFRDENKAHFIQFIPVVTRLGKRCRNPLVRPACSVWEVPVRYL